VVLDHKTLGITPDVYARREGDRFVVTDNDAGLARLMIDERLVRRMQRDPRAREFLRLKLEKAKWLIQSIERRRRTIIRVAECILEKQRDFFVHGAGALKAMTLQDVSREIGVHESTVSRATMNKYIDTPRGLFELKYFFNPGVSCAGECDVASEAVKDAIKGFVAREDKAMPLSDQAIVELLAARKGIKIARRTVAKYRESLRIPSSGLRKEMF
jgi:RNA polymerase sigma-54 factor